MNKFKNIITELQKETDKLRDHYFTVNGINLDRHQLEESILEDYDVSDFFNDDDCLIELMIFLFENKDRYVALYEDFTEAPFKQDFIVECDDLMKDCATCAFDYVVVED